MLNSETKYNQYIEKIEKLNNDTHHINNRLICVPIH